MNDLISARHYFIKKLLVGASSYHSIIV